MSTYERAAPTTVSTAACTHVPIVNVAVIVALVHAAPATAQKCGVEARSDATPTHAASDDESATRASPPMSLVVPSSTSTSACVTVPCCAGRALSAPDRTKLSSEATWLVDSSRGRTPVGPGSCSSSGGDVGARPLPPHAAIDTRSSASPRVAASAFCTTPIRWRPGVSAYGTFGASSTLTLSDASGGVCAPPLAYVACAYR